MKKCADFLELASAQQDGEITQSETEQLNAHLHECDNCSAILELYREMSTAVSELKVDAPEVLCSNVMEKIMSEKKPAGQKKSNAHQSKKKSGAIIMLKRYLPAVACLAIILLALPWVISNRLGQSEEIVSLPDAIAEVDSFSTVFGRIALPEEDLSSEVSLDNGMPFSSEIPESAQSEPTAAPSAPGQVTEQAPVVGSSPDAHSVQQTEPSPEQVAEQSGGQVNAQPEEWITGDADDADFGAGGVSEEAPFTDEFIDTENENEPSRVPEAIPAPALAPPATDGYSIVLEMMNEAYAWIEIIGGALPEQLSAFEAESLGNLTNWDKVFIISLAAAEAIIAEIGSREGVTISYVDRTSSFALVLYAIG